MQQTIQHKIINTEGVIENQIVLNIKDIKYDNSLTVVEMTVEDAMELHRLLGNKLGEIKRMIMFGKAISDIDSLNNANGRVFYREQISPQAVIGSWVLSLCDDLSSRVGACHNVCKEH